jgi:hypothetical protein
MNDKPVIERLRAINPLPEDPSPPPIALMLEALDESVRFMHDPVQLASVPRHARLRRPLVVAGTAACGIAAAGIVLSALPGGGTVDVAAAMYRALTPSAGVLHMTTVTEQTIGGKALAPGREQIWTAQQPRRMRVLIANGEGDTSEAAVDTAPPKQQQWFSWQPNVIKQSVPTEVPPMTRQSPVEALRSLYAKGMLTVVGKTTGPSGEAAWKLEVHPSSPQPTFEGHQLPNPMLLVDASTFVPLELVDETVSHGPGKPELISTKTRYTEYQELPATPASEALLELASHPGAHVETEG